SNSINDKATQRRSACCHQDIYQPAGVVLCYKASYYNINGKPERRPIEPGKSEHAPNTERMNYSPQDCGVAGDNVLDCVQESISPLIRKRIGSFNSTCARSFLQAAGSRAASRQLPTPTIQPPPQDSPEGSARSKCHKRRTSRGSKRQRESSF